jgi:hypothetical protein
VDADGRVRRLLGRTAWGLTAAALLAATVFEVTEHGGGTVPLAVLGGIGPDLTFLAGAGQPHAAGQLPPRAVHLYNLAHRPCLPLAAMIGSAFTGQPTAAALFSLGAAWATHVALDRACGYGLRSADGYRR